MKIVELRAENVKRLSAVIIKPTDDVVQITGRNDQGKSSVLDSIWFALGGAEAFDSEPIRAGADEASIYLDLGEIKVTRKIKRREGTPSFTSSLIVENAEGMRPKSPHTLLNELVGRFSLDPLAFSRMRAKEQFDALKVLVPGFDFDASAAADAEAYERRTVENRKGKEAKAAAGALGASETRVAEIDEQPILADLARAGEFNQSIEERRRRRTEAKQKILTLEDKAKECGAKIADLLREISVLEENQGTAREEALTLIQKLAEAPSLPEPLDTVKLSEALSAARAVNVEASKQRQRDEMLKAGLIHEGRANDLTVAMEARAAARTAAIIAAELPVAGLSLGADEVLIDGFPFAQAATSKKIRTSVALAMAMNPKIRVIRIMDGSLLDSDAMQPIADMAAAKDFQVWIEKVDTSGTVGVVIEDGHIKEK